MITISMAMITTMMPFAELSQAANNDVFGAVKAEAAVLTHRPRAHEAAGTDGPGAPQ